MNYVQYDWNLGLIILIILGEEYKSRSSTLPSPHPSAVLKLY
jgi:hypothetical protein